LGSQLDFMLETNNFNKIKDNLERGRNMEKLPLNRIKPKELESLYSFLHRLALVNHYEHIGSMFTELKAAAFAENCNEIHPSLYWVDFIIDLLNKLKIDIQPLIVNQYDDLLIREDKESSYRRYDYRKHYHRYSTKFCPDCLKEDFFHHIYWDVCYVTTCIKHKKDLITKCSKCGEFIRLSQLMRNACRCGKKFTVMKAKSADPITLDVQTIFQDFLLGNRIKIKRADRKYLSREEYLEFFYLFSNLIKEVDSEIFTLSSLFRFNGNFKMIAPNIREINLNKINLIVNTLHFLTLEPSNDFTSLIEAISETGNELSYMPKAKSQKYRILNNMFKHPKGTYYYEIYTRYLNNKTDEYINQRFALPPMEKGIKYIPIHQAIKLLKTEYNTLMNLCHHNLIKLHVTLKNGKKVSLIERESIEEYREMKNTNFTLDQATKYLGLNFNHMKELIRLKLIKPLHGPSVDGYEIWYIPKKEIMHFEKEVKKKYLPLPSVKGKEGISIKLACFKLRRDQINVGEVYQLIFNDRLRVFHDGSSKLINGLKVLDEDVNQLVKELYYKRINDKGYLGKEIERACKSSQESIKLLLNDQVLKIDFSERYGKRIPNNYIKKQQIIEYLKKYKGMNNHLIEQHLMVVETSFEPKV
jgi:hypothetical protein